MGMPCTANICIISSRGGDPIRGTNLLKKFGSVLTLPWMLLYFMQSITFNESLFRDWCEEKKKR